MGYKRDGKKLLHDEAEWKNWRKEYADLIASSGVPELVVSDADHWYDFLDHGILDHHKDPLHFDVDHLTVRQKAFLLQLVGTDVSGFSSIVGLGLIADLISAVKERYRE
jgi:hypothetical protein